MLASVRPGRGGPGTAESRLARERRRRCGPFRGVLLLMMMPRRQLGVYNRVDRGLKSDIPVDSPCREVRAFRP